MILLRFFLIKNQQKQGLHKQHLQEIQRVNLQEAIDIIFKSFYTLIKIFLKLKHFQT